MVQFAGYFACEVVVFVLLLRLFGKYWPITDQQKLMVLVIIFQLALERFFLKTPLKPCFISCSNSSFSIKMFILQRFY